MGGTFGLDWRRRRGSTFVCFEMGWDGKIISGCIIYIVIYEDDTVPPVWYNMVGGDRWRG